MSINKKRTSCHHFNSSVPYSKSALLKGIQNNLMSRNNNRQILAVKKVLELVESENSEMIDILLISNVPSILCEVMNNHNLPLIEKVFRCLLKLSRHEQFYSQKHSMIVIEHTCRTVRILCKEERASVNTIYAGLHLLNQTLSRTDKEAVNLPALLGLVRTIVFNPMFHQIHLNAIFLLHQILRMEMFANKELLTVTRHSLELLILLHNNNEMKFKQNISLVADIIFCSLRLGNFCKNHQTLSHSVSGLAWDLVQSSIVPFIKKVQMRHFRKGFIMKLLNCLLAAFSLKDPRRLNHMSSLWASQGFLILLPKISLHFSNNSVHGRSLSILSHMLERLADRHLQLSEDEQQLMKTGLLQLPVDSETWPKYLSQAHQVHVAVVVYHYFKFLCVYSFKNCPTDMPVLCHYLISQTSTPSLALLKAIWLVFAVWSLSRPKGSARKQQKVAGKILVRWVRSAGLDHVFTHHPAILYWSFSPLISNRELQIDVMIHWLKNKDEKSLKEIENIVLNSKEAAICLLDVLCCCSREVTRIVVPILRTVLERDRKKSCGLEMSSHIWRRLPHVLSELTTPNFQSKVSNVASLVYLACKSVPDSVFLLQTGHQLLRAIPHLNNIPADCHFILIELFKLAITVILKSKEVKEFRVLNMYLRDSGLRQILVDSLSSDNKFVVIQALRLLSCLRYVQKLFNIQMDSSIYLSGDLLLQLMSSPSGDVVCHSLKLFSLLQSSNNIKPVVALNNEMTDKIVLTLNLEFQTATVRKPFSCEGWQCLSQLLEYCSAHKPQVELHLLRQQFTYMVIEQALKSDDDYKAIHAPYSISRDHVLMYLNVWLSSLHRREVAAPVRHIRALQQDRLTTTIIAIASRLTATTTANISSTASHLHGEIAAKILDMKTIIPDHLIQSLRRRY